MEGKAVGYLNKKLNRVDCFAHITKFFSTPPPLSHIKYGHKFEKSHWLHKCAMPNDFPKIYIQIESRGERDVSAESSINVEGIVCIYNKTKLFIGCTGRIWQKGYIQYNNL